MSTSTIVGPRFQETDFKDVTPEMRGQADATADFIAKKVAALQAEHVKERLANPGTGGFGHPESPHNQARQAAMEEERRNPRGDISLTSLNHVDEMFNHAAAENEIHNITNGKKQ